jgi:hypothetical protein
MFLIKKTETFQWVLWTSSLLIIYIFQESLFTHNNGRIGRTIKFHWRENQDRDQILKPLFNEKSKNFITCNTIIIVNSFYNPSWILEQTYNRCKLGNKTSVIDSKKPKKNLEFLDHTNLNLFLFGSVWKRDPTCVFKIFEFFFCIKLIFFLGFLNRFNALI